MVQAWNPRTQEFEVGGLQGNMLITDNTQVLFMSSYLPNMWHVLLVC
jgi:hypothetical protein